MTTRTIDPRSEHAFATDELISRKSKETNGHIVDKPSKENNSPEEVHAKVAESVGKQILNDKLPDNFILENIRKSFNDSVELSEEAMETIISMQSQQLNSVIDLNRKLTDSLRNLDYSNKQEVTDLIGAIRKNFDESSNRLVENTRKMSELYNKQINLAMSFNDRLSKNINHQMQILNLYTARNTDLFNAWTFSWWKPTPIDHYDLDKE